MNNLKEREKKILDYMKKIISTKGYPPTVREICSALGIKSTSTAHKDIENLVRAGYLKKDPAKPRALMVVDNDANVYNNMILGESSTVNVPVVGAIAAGTPITATENIEDFVPIPTRFAGNGQNFILKVKGESMINAGIMNGDYIVVEQTSNANNGEIVAALIDGIEAEATVKTFYKEKDYIRLQPENDTMSPIIVKNVTILGKVKSVFRNIS